jgi:hypothetical protein
MPCGIEKDPNVLLRLMLQQCRSEIDGSPRLSVKVRYLEVEVGHHLLLAWLGWPSGSNIAGVPLDVQVGHALAGI